jgi:fibrillarin-like pre-rRNA processing protein
MKLKVKPHRKFLGIYRASLEDRSANLATLNLSPSRRVYGERLVEYEGDEYRLWDPYKSKLAAAILKGLPNVPVQPSHKVLYLGAASGTTVSHVSDIVGAEGCVYCIEFSFRPLRDLIGNVSAFRDNVFPILADARFPERYRMLVEAVDGVYCDIAQPEQARVLADNADMFLREGGWALLVVKARSIDSTEEPSKIFRREVDVLKERGFDVKKVVRLKPYDKAHVMVLAEYALSSSSSIPC